MKRIKPILCFLTFILAISFQIKAFSQDFYEWYWGGDVIPRHYSEYCDEPGINTTCQQTCEENGLTFPNNGIGEGNGQAYCKELVTHYKLWCSCEGVEKQPQCQTGIAVIAGVYGCPGACTVKCNLLCAPEGGYCSDGPETPCYSGIDTTERCDCGELTCNIQDGPTMAKPKKSTKSKKPKKGH